MIKLLESHVRINIIWRYTYTTYYTYFPSIRKCNKTTIDAYVSVYLYTTQMYTLIWFFIIIIISHCVYSEDVFGEVESKITPLCRYEFKNMVYIFFSFFLRLQFQYLFFRITKNRVPRVRHRCWFSEKGYTPQSHWVVSCVHCLPSV